LYTNGKYKGAPAGKYKMTVTKVFVEQSKFGPPLEEGAPGYDEWRSKVSQEKLEIYSVVDKKYADIQISPLNITVPAKERHFDLGSPVRDIPAQEER
jgi:hypothetical protein